MVRLKIGRSPSGLLMASTELNGVDDVRGGSGANANDTSISEVDHVRKGPPELDTAENDW